MGFIDTMRAEGHAVESICRVLREQGCQVAARTYRAWRSRPPAARTVSDAHVVDAVGDLAWTVGVDGRRRLAAEGLYGRRKMTALLRRTSLPGVSAGAVDRAMTMLSLSGVRRDKGVRTTISAKDGMRAGDLLNRNLTAPAPNRVWVSDFTYVRTWAGFVYVAFIVDVFAQRIVAWHAMTSKVTDLVMVPLRMALWQRDRDGHAADRQRHRQIQHDLRRVVHRGRLPPRPQPRHQRRIQTRHPDRIGQKHRTTLTDSRRGARVDLHPRIEPGSVPHLESAPRLGINRSVARPILPSQEHFSVDQHELTPDHHESPGLTTSPSASSGRPDSRPSTSTMHGVIAP